MKKAQRLAPKVIDIIAHGGSFTSPEDQLFLWK
jgi:hypothetical protein